jgi:putative ATP-binding cassette transporter
MRFLSLAVFAAFALAVGFYERDGTTIGLAVSAGLAAAASLPMLRVSTFLELMAEIFAAETVVFGLADIANTVGLWPETYREYAVARYLPVATAVFVIAITLISRLGLVRRMMAIADPFFEARTPITVRPPMMRPFIVRQTRYARACVVFLILMNQAQVAISVRMNFFQNDFGNAIQVPDEAHRIAFWHQLIYVFMPLAAVSISAAMIEFFVASNFVLQWRRWMTGSYTARWLLHSMHYKLALGASTADNPDQRISQDIGGFINGSGTGSNSGNIGIYNYTLQVISSATNLVSFSIILWGISKGMTIPFLDVEVPGYLFWVAVLYACFATGITQLIGRRLSGLYFRQQAVEANFRFGLARVREYSEQIALLKGEAREVAHAGTVFEDIFMTIRRIINVRVWLIAFNSFYSLISAIMPYVIVAPYYYLKKVTFGQFNQAADAFGNVNTQMNFFVDRYIGLADFSATVARLTSFDEAFARAMASQSRSPRVETRRSTGEALAIPDLELALPDGRKLARIGNLMLVPQESTLVVGPSGAGKSTLFRAISGLWPFGAGEILQPAYAKLMLLPQRPYIPIGPLRDALAYPSASSAFAEEELRDALTKVGLGAWLDRLDESDNWQMRLSGGEQQRLAVARALLAKPDWLFLDEATASLDEDSEAEIYRVIARALPNATIISIGHRSTLSAFHKRRIELKTREGEPATIVG